jgi:hypothetical protein
MPELRIRSVVMSPSSPAAKGRGVGAGSLKVVALLFIMGVSLCHCARYPHLREHETYVYHYIRKGTEIGTEVFSVEKTGGKLAIKSDINIGEADRFQRGNSELILRKNGKPLAYSRRLEVRLPEVPAQNGVWEFKFDFQGKRVMGDITKDGVPQWSGTVEMGKGRVYCIDNNAISLLAILIKAIYPEMREETAYSVRAIHFSEARVRDVIFRKGRDGTYNCRIGGVDVGDLLIRDGIVLKHEDTKTGLVILLK